MNKLSKYLKYLFERTKPNINFRHHATTGLIRPTAFTAVTFETEDLKVGDGISYESGAFVINDSSIKYVEVNYRLSLSPTDSASTYYAVCALFKNTDKIPGTQETGYTRSGAATYPANVVVLPVSVGDRITVQIFQDGKNKVRLDSGSRCTIRAI